ncbi:MAG: DUF4199 domain-containing protein [Chitinophagaceae bacterium]|nr:DUF4199 domain-containing protein [Chitinophagaceae bacterium]MCB9045715.1 DUF4199 domain-containing protein [Chitinophagales bacterium]
MKKIVLTFGSISGIITGGMLLLTGPSMFDMDNSNGALIGYTTMVIALSTIFIGIKMYRDKYLGGAIKFGRAFLLGIYISLLGSFIYAAGWELTLAVNDLDPMMFMQKYAEGEARKLAGAGMSEAEIAEKSTAMLEQWQWYANPILRFLWTMIFEMFFVGVVISLICAGILRKKEALPAQAS